MEKIAEIIANDKPDAAAAYVESVLNSVTALSDFPYSGRKLSEFPASGYRELIVAPARIIYRPLADSIVLVRVIRGERQIHREMLGESAT